MPSSVLHDKIPHSILVPNQPLFCLPPRVFSYVCFVHILTLGQDKLSVKAMKCVFLCYSRLQLGYRCYSPDIHRYFVFTDVTFFNNSFMFPTTHPLSSNVTSLPLLYPVLDTSSIPPATPSRPLQVYTCRPRTDVKPLADSSPMVPSSMMPVLPSPADLPIAVQKGTNSSCNPLPIIISRLIIAYLYHILLLFSPCLLFLFLKLCMRHSLIRARNRQWLKKWVLCILLAHGT